MTRLTVLPVVAVVALALAPVACGSGSASPYEAPPLNGYGDGGSSSGVDGSTSSHADGGEAGTPSDGSTGPHPDGGTTPDGSVVPPTTCPATFTLPDASYTTVVLDTDYGNWTNAIPLTKNGSNWQVVTQVPYDTDVEYKFVADGTWMTASGQPVVSLPSQSGTNVNNILQGVTCGLPAAGTLQLVGGAVTTSATSYSFQVKYVPGAADLDPSKTVVTMNGAALAADAVPYDAASHTFTASVSSGVTSPNKYGYLFQVADTNGMAARLFVPFWIEAKPYDWTDAFLYEVMVDRFVAGGTSKVGPNGPPTDPVGDWKGGDFGGVTQKIQAGYFDAMGVNALWLSSPVIGTKLCEMGAGANAGHCLSGYHSYFPLASGWTYGSESDPRFVDFTTPIEPHFGTAADLTALVNAAHAHGIRVLTDLVVNHVFADGAPPDGQPTQLGPLWKTHQADQAWFNIPYGSSTNDCGNENLWDTPTTQTWNRADCWFDPYLPDLNSTNPSVDDAIAAHAVWLMEQFDLDGFRVDAVKQVTNGICSAMRTQIDGEVATKLPFYMVGEALGGVVSNVMDCVGTDKLNGSMDDPLHNTIVGTILQSDGNAGTDLDNGVQYDDSTWTGVVPTALMGHFFGSHDTPRAISLANGDDVGDPWTNAPPAQETNPAAFSHLQLAQAFLLTYDPIPVLWMGDEFGMPGAIDPDCRRVMRFGSALSTQEQATLTNLQKLGTTRAAHTAFRRGARTRLWVDASFYAYGRVDASDGDIVVAAFNLGTGAASRTMSVTNIGLTGTVTDALSGATATVANGTLTVSLPALTAAVFTK
ncbi:MAG TPA: alpha-amylase family glycosyl hydrolase [Polyangiaceae bacterium]|jgi:glycosidase